MTAISKRVDSDVEYLVSNLQELIRIPSVSAKNQFLEECAKLVSKIMNDAGIWAELLYLEEGVKSEKIPPIVFGEVKSRSNPSGKTILFYNHYDVQPPDPLDLWHADPFSGNREGNFIFGRG